MAFYGNPVGGFCYPKTYILTDENGNEMATGVVVGEKTVFDATPADVNVGKIFASDEGVQEGTNTKKYRTTRGSKIVLPGESYFIKLDQYEQYNYTEFQAMIAEFNTTNEDSVSVVKVSLNNSVYNVNSIVKLSDVTTDPATQSINLNIVNNTDNQHVIHYMVYKED